MLKESTGLRLPDRQTWKNWRVGSCDIPLVEESDSVDVVAN